jgi:hypothetical protein
MLRLAGLGRVGAFGVQNTTFRARRPGRVELSLDIDA